MMDRSPRIGVVDCDALRFVRFVDELAVLVGVGDNPVMVVPLRRAIGKWEGGARFVSAEILAGSLQHARISEHDLRRFGQR